MGVIYRREMQSYFYTPAAYVFMGVFLTLSSIFFAIDNLASRSSNLLPLLSQMSYLWMLLSPLLTMRLLAGECRQGTENLLLSSPCSLTAQIAGKYFAAVTVMLCTVAATGVYALIVMLYGRFYAAETMVAYAGLILEGCAFLALDLFISSLMASPMTAVVAGFGANLLVWLADILAVAVSADWLSTVLRFISLNRRFEPFIRGQLSFSNVLYDLLFSFVMLFLCVRVLDARRWSDA